MATRIAHMGNSLSVLMLAQSQILQLEHTYPSVCYMNNAAFQAFISMTRDLGRLMSTLLVTHHIWMAQAPMFDDSRRTLRQIPVGPGQILNPAAK
ncbi:hypothetical protein AAFF_G00234630 [Aldrovandia affinis]|uniref:Uncharacterized protein n=1 Tax=Aldrovandia affinis TaxID=143900 RepID=A0AAD7SV58_9TELE|nr:hypothetical protein AAFF_G00234630 [Aldrovandia affinis]